MIAFDATQAQHIDHPAEWKPCLFLEQATGADYLISPLSLPVKSEGLIAKHLAAGGVLIQLKINGDLPASYDDGRMVNAICRMFEFQARHKLCLKPAQRILLPIGAFTSLDSFDEMLQVNGQAHPTVTYKRFIGGMQAWIERGGVIEFPLDNKAMFPWWMENKEKHLQEIATHPVKEFIQLTPEMLETSNDPMQLPIKVKDGRRLLRAFLSEAKTHALWDFADRNLLKAIQAITDYNLLKHPMRPEGIGKGTIDHARKVFNLTPGHLISEVKEDGELYICQHCHKAQEIF